MKRFKSSRYSLLVLLAAALMFALTACGGGGGGGGGGKKAGLPNGTFEKTAFDTNFGFLNNFTNSVAQDRRLQMLLPADMVNGSGYITAIDFIANTTTSSNITCPNISIKMGHTNVSSLSTTYASNYETGQGTFETVRAGSQMVIPPVSTGEYFTIKLDTPYYYNGADNLVVEYIRTGYCDGEVLNGSDSSTTAYGVWTNDLASATGTGAYANHVKLHFKGGVDQITQDGTGTGWFYPFTTSTVNQKVQMLYLADEINGSGPITGMALKVGLTTSNAVFTLDIKVGHTALGGLVAGSDFADNFSGKPVTVASGAIWNVPAGVPAGEYIWLPFPDGVFKYNGTDNLLIEYNITSASGGFTPASFSPLPTSRRLYGPSGGTTSTGEAAALYIARFRFKGGTLDVIPTATQGTTSQVMQGTDSQIAFLYPATQLGTKGKISKIALRLNGASSAHSYPNHKIVIGYSDDFEFDLVDNYLDQMTNEKTVRSATFDVPAGLKAGDWVEIPLSSSFTYDPTKNLVIYFDNTGGGASTIYRTVYGTPEFVNRTCGDSSQNSSADTVPDWLDDHEALLRLWVN